MLYFSGIRYSAPDSSVLILVRETRPMYLMVAQHPLRSITSREKMQLKSQMLRAVNVVEDWIIVSVGSGSVRHQRRHGQDARPTPGSKDFFRLFSLS